MKYMSFLLALFSFIAFAVASTEERVAILGDSIAYAGGWPTYVESHLRQDQRWKNAKIVNFGLPSETLSGLSEEGHAGGAFPRPCLFDRLPRILGQFRPTLVLACYGMNDGIMKPLSQDRLDAFARGCRKLDHECRAVGADLVWITPTLYAPGTQAAYDLVLDKEAQWLNEQAKRQGWKVVDIRPSLKKSVKERMDKDRSFKYAGDGVHPGPEGHRMAAQAICEGLQKILGLPRPKFPEGVTWNQAFQKQEQTKREWLEKTKHARPGVPGYVKDMPSPQAEGRDAVIS